MKAAAKSNHELVKEVSALLNQVTGIQLGPRQAHMVESKLTRRMLDLGIEGWDEYHAYLKEHLNDELPALVSLMTTHHTFFFREFFHFEYLEKTALPGLIEAMRKENRKTLRVWSAACSRGQEVYSLSMCLFHYFRRFAPDLNFEIFGSDVDPESVRHAQNGVYKWDEVKEIPLAYMAGHWARGTGEIADFVKAKASIKGATKFGVVNLFDLGTKLSGQTFDIVFCRNVFIYFAQEQIKAITQNILQHMHSEGYLFLGISESLGGIHLPIAHLGQSVYRKREVHLSVASSTKTVTAPAKTPATRPSLSVVPAPAVASSAPVTAKPATPAAPILRVMCVDDSPVILTLLKKLLGKEFGFEVVATAGNGLEAAEKLKTTQVDLITLDIHMPEQTGVEYLQRNYKPGHPPVVMVSSVARENGDLALKALDYGASDYIEKPSVGDITARGDEIRMKLRCAAEREAVPPLNENRLEKAFESRELIQHPESKVRVFVGGVGDLKNFARVCRESQTNQPPTLIFIRGAESALPAVVSKLKSEGVRNVDIYSDPSKAMQPNGVCVADYAKHFNDLRHVAQMRQAAILLFGPVTGEMIRDFKTWPNSEIVVEESQSNMKTAAMNLKEGEGQVVPVTSFSYLADSFLSKEGKVGKAGSN